MRETGFYLVKLSSNSKIDKEHWEPAFYYGKEKGWGLCGQDPIDEDEGILDISEQPLSITLS